MPRLALALALLGALACPVVVADDEPRPATITASTLNVRKGPGTEHPVEFQLRRGARVVIVGRRGDWCAIESEGRRGWAHSRYVQPIREAVAMPATRAEKVRFVLDPERSVLDLLGEQGPRWRAFAWDRNDYPGSPRGPNEDEARALAGRVADLLPTRRVNTGPFRLPFDYEAIHAEWVAVPGQESYRLHREAAARFVEMREAAARDGVSLVLVSAGRTLDHQKRLAAANDNPDAVAQGVSTHNYGLAIDLAMKPGAAHDYQEVTTRPFSNVLLMRESPVHKWMFFFGAEHGWYAYHNEPWHWEYNPPGLADRFPR